MLSKMINKISRKSKLLKINREFTAHIHRIASQLTSGKRNEEETRRWCVDIVRLAFGYDDSDIETEMQILGKRVDIAVKMSGKTIMVIECKAATVKLNAAALKQAANYAVALGAPWAVVTNGRSWSLYHVSQVTGGEPDVYSIFDVDILDEDGLSESDAENLYLLSRISMKNGDALQAFRQIRAMSLESIRDAVLDPRILHLIAAYIKTEQKKKYGADVNIDENELKGSLEYMFDITDAAASI